MDATLLAVGLGALVGLMLALTGAGGGVLAIPLLVFGLHLPVQQAAPAGLLAVGLAAAVGAIVGLQQGVVRYRAAAVIGGVGMLMAPLGVFMAQRLPNRPLLAAFAMVLVYTAWRMLRAPALARQNSADVPCHVGSADQRLVWTRHCAWVLAGTGLVSGMLSGLLGVGGGFVIVPALMRYSDLAIRSIQGTSLAVIALVSLSGVAAAAWYGSLPWAVALPFSAGAMMALLVGRLVSSQLQPAHLQHAFAWFSLAVASVMLARVFGLAVN